MDRWRGRVALVTGASVGIGAAIAKSLTQHGMKVIGCARNVDQIEPRQSLLSCILKRSGHPVLLRMQNLASECIRNGFSGTLVPYKCDLSVEEEILSMFAWIKDQHHGIEVCINNAGLAFPEPLLRGKTSYWRTMLDVNVIGLSVCTREAYQSMKERNVNDGHIININSMCGYRVMNHADAHFYTATKYAVTALTEGLRQELRETKSHIRATSISPGLVETKFTTRLYSDKPEIAAAAYRRIKCLQAEDIANALVYVLSCPSHVQIGDLQVMPLEQMYL